MLYEQAVGLACLCRFAGLIGFHPSEENSVVYSPFEVISALQLGVLAMCEKVLTRPARSESRGTAPIVFFLGDGCTPTRSCNGHGVRQWVKDTAGDRKIW